MRQHTRVESRPTESLQHSQQKVNNSLRTWEETALQNRIKMCTILIALSLGDTRSLVNTRGYITAKSNISTQKIHKALRGRHEFVWDQKTRKHIRIELRSIQPSSALNAGVPAHLRSRNQRAPHNGGTSEICTQ